MHKINFKFDNSYLNLPDKFYSNCSPNKVNNPKLVIANYDLAQELGLDFSNNCDDELAQILSGNTLPEGAKSIACAYAGHQFGHFNILGDGRAHLIGEHISPDEKRFDIQFKGSGRTPYSRGGDGKAALAPMLREYTISEFMHGAGVKTTRSLAVVTSGEPVMRETMLTGAVLTRVASSHLRVGTFEYAASLQNKSTLKQLADYTINRHYPSLKESKQPYLELIKQVMDLQTDLIINWLRVGFIHGVMNTDNVALSGETIDYGPCAFMDSYDPQTVFSSIDHKGRYAFANQPYITKWNITRFAESLITLIDDDETKAIAMATQIIESFNTNFQSKWLGMMRKKLGLLDEQSNDKKIISELLKIMQKNNMDYTNVFNDLSLENLPDNDSYQDISFKKWHSNWQDRLQASGGSHKDSINLMQQNNPVFIPRNHNVEQALTEAEEKGDLSVFEELLQVVKTPYLDKDKYQKYKNPPQPNERVYQTFCGT